MFSKKCIFAHFYLIFFRRNIDLSFRKSSPLRWYSVLKVYLKNVYTRHYFKMRKILTGAKLLLMSICLVLILFPLVIVGHVGCLRSVLTVRLYCQRTIIIQVGQTGNPYQEHNLSRDMKKPVCGVSVQVRHKPACTVTEESRTLKLWI